MNIQAGFSKIDLMKILPEKRSCEMPLSARGFYLSGTNSGSFFLIADFMDFDLAAISFLKNAASAELPENTRIHIMTTHNHGGAVWNQLDTERFAELVRICTKQAVENSCEAKVRFAQGFLSQKVSFNRRIYVPETDGSFTCFYGVDSTDPGNASAFVKTALENLEQGKLTFSGSGEPAVGNTSFPDGDQEISIIEFQTVDDRPIGNIVRFAAHAVCCNLPDCYSSDYPGYLRELLEHQLGGISIFMNGPCAEIAPVLRKKSPEAGKKTARILAEKALKILEKETFRNLEKFTDTCWEIPLPIRKELICSEETESQLSDQNNNLRCKKESLEKERFRSTVPFLQGICRNGVFAHDRFITVSTALLQLNEWNLLFFSGETFFETAKKITNKFPHKKWITLTEHGRTAMYIPPEKEYFRGGYEPSCATVSPAGEDELQKQMTELLKKQFEKGFTEK